MVRNIYKADNIGKNMEVVKMNKDRKTPEQIKNEILIELENGPKNISEIAEKVKSNWMTIEKFINELRDEGKVLELISAPKSKVYASKSDLSFFYLPINSKAREKTLSLLYDLNKKWKDKTGSSPLKTTLQKLAVEFVQNNDLQNEIPILRFHYGQTLALRFEEDKGKIKSFDFDIKQEKEVDNLIDIYKDFSAKDAKKRQYEKPSMRFYAEKEEMWSALSSNDTKKAQDNLISMMTYYYPDLSQSCKLFDRLVYCAINIFNSKDYDEILPSIKEIYSLVWDCLTTEAYFNDVERFIEPEKKELFYQIKSNYLNSKLINAKMLLDELENEVNSLETKDTGELSDFVHELFS
jgi:predicted transcriptional regulator